MIATFATMALLAIGLSAEQTPSEPQPPSQPQGTNRPSGPVQQRIAPGLATLTDEVLFGDVWRRPELSPRDRSLVTVSVLIATGKPAQLTGHLGRALDNGVKPGEASGVLAHLAIYCGWPSAVSALDVYNQVYTARNVDTAALRDVAPRLPAPESDAARARALNDELATVAPKFVQLTNDVVFGDLWRRSDLAPRDRSLVTIAALAAMGDDDQLDLYLRRGLESGLTRAQITEALTHLGFYAGWPKASKAIAAVALVQVPAGNAPADADVATLTRLETDWNTAHVRGDAAALDQLFADDIVVMVPGMRVMTKADAVGMFTTGRMKFDRYETSETTFRVYDSTAIVTGRLRRTRVIAGATADDDWRFTKVYARRANRWQVVSFHASNTSP